MVKYQVVFLKHIQILLDLTVFIFTTQQHTWLWQQCVPPLLHIMRYHTVNVCYVVVVNAPVWSYLVRRGIQIQQKHSQHYVLISTKTYHVLHLMADSHKKNAQRVHCFSQSLILILLQTYTHGRSLCYYRYQLHSLTRSYIYRQKNWHFICHMCASQVPIIVAKKSVSNLSAGESK